jgi:prepilin-type N-terminal cleavage/methylation domain-containing protein
MFKKMQQFNDQQQGFTIIEVLVVLAIAGLIMVVVFLAVPNLQRSQRNNARKSDANNLLQNLSEYIGNSNGSLPTAACGPSPACSWISYTPQQLTNVSYYTAWTAALNTSITTDTTNSTVYLIGQATCNGPVAAAGSARQYAIMYEIEGSTKTICTSGS